MAKDTSVGLQSAKKEKLRVAQAAVKQAAKDFASAQKALVKAGMAKEKAEAVLAKLSA